MEEMNQLTSVPPPSNTSDSLAWLKAHISNIHPVDDHTEQARKEQQEREAAIQEIKAQQEELSKKLLDLEKGNQAQDKDSPLGDILRQALGKKDNPRGSQEVLLQQLRSALEPRKEEDPNKALLRALLTQQNKTTAEGGTSTLKPNILSKMLQGDNTTMAKWLATLNKQEEGESELSRFPFPGEEEGNSKGARVKSGILDKATANIQQKQVWPQQNLGEDWADEEVEFKQIRFEHMVTGGTRTIETCTEPAEILGRLQLLRRISYLKLRGYEWNLIRKMYAAILTSIETKEYSWESNFDRFETILYRKVAIEGRAHHGEPRHNDREGRKRYCREFNRPEGCPKNSPHPVWFGNGPSAVRRMVYHFCAACLVRDRQQKDHPEGHPNCPYRD